MKFKTNNSTEDPPMEGEQLLSASFPSPRSCWPNLFPLPLTLAPRPRDAASSSARRSLSSLEQLPISEPNASEGRLPPLSLSLFSYSDRQPQPPLGARLAGRMPALLVVVVMSHSRGNGHSGGGSGPWMPAISCKMVYEFFCIFVYFLIQLFPAKMNFLYIFY